MTILTGSQLFLVGAIAPRDERGGSILLGEHAEADQVPFYWTVGLPLT